MEKSRRKGRRKHKPTTLGPRFTKEYSETKDITNDISIFDNSVLTPYLNLGTCRYFVMKSFSEANIHKSIKYGIWTSTYNNNITLDIAFKSDLACIRPILLFFSVCGSKNFYGIARMTSSVYFDMNFMLWEKEKYESYFHLEWLVLKDVPNYYLLQIVLNQKNFTRACDGEEIPYKEATEFMNLYLAYPSKTSLLDDMEHYNIHQTKLQETRGLNDVDGLDIVPFLKPIQ